MKARFALAGALCLTAGCPDDSTATGTDDGSTSSDDTTTTAPPTTTAPSTSGVGTTTLPPASTGEGSSESGVVVGCGDGQLDEDEQCDDGNQVDDDECSNDCIPRCGLMWEVVLPVGPNVRFAALEDENIRLGGLSGETILYTELLDGDGNSLEMEEYDVGLVTYATSSVVTAVLPRGSASFGRHDLGNGMGARVAVFDEANVVFDVEPEPLLIDEPGDRSIALAPNGDIVIAGAINVTDGDDDVWVASLDGSTGAVDWTGTFGGPLVGGFSTDDSGPVAVAGDGTVYALGLIRQGLDMIDAYVIKFPATGGDPVWTNPIRVDTGAEDLFLSSIDADEDGNALVTVLANAGATSIFEISRVLPNGDVDWTFTTEDLVIELDDDDDDIISPRVRFADDGSVTVLAQLERGVVGDDTVVFRLSPEGEQICVAKHQVLEIEGDRRPTHLVVMPDGGAGVVGERAGSDLDAEWVARFRP